MKSLKKFFCLVLVTVMAVGIFSGCHKANEVAITFGTGNNKTEITSGYYLCTLISAYQEAQQKVSEAKSEETTDEESTQEIDYLKEKIDGKSFTEWVENRTMEILTNYAALQHELKANKIELGEEELEEVENYANTYWTQYGYQAIYEKNGVSYETFKKFMRASNEDYVYFDSIYGHEGKNAVKKEDIMAHIREHYVAVDRAYYSLTDSEGNALEETEVAKLKKKLNNYADKLNAGTTTFAKVYKAVNGELAEGATYSTFVGDDQTDYEISDFAKIKKMKKHKAMVVETESALTLYYKQSITDKSYESLHETAVYKMKHDDFEKDLDEIGKTLKVSKNKFALSNLKVKNIDLSTDAE